MYRLIDHTGDIGIEVKGENLQELFKDAISALYSIFLDLKILKKKGEEELIIEGKDLEEILVETLNEIIYLFEVKKIIFIDFKEFAIEENQDKISLKSKMSYDVFDSTRHKILGAGVKAATYHNIVVKKENDKYFARIIIDV